MNIEQLKYPIGHFEHAGEISNEEIQNWLDEIVALPEQLRSAVAGLTEEQLDTPYRPEGWTVRQVVHHIADSHLNSLIRFKWALTEDTPTIKTYFEDRWGELADYSLVPLESSLNFIASLHERWVILLRSLDERDLSKEFIHPESGPVKLGRNIGIYAWHGRHHLAHITNLIERMGLDLRGSRMED